MNKFIEILKRIINGFMTFVYIGGGKSISFLVLILVLITCIFMYFNPKTNPKSDESRVCDNYVTFVGDRKIKFSTFDDLTNEELKNMYYKKNHDIIEPRFQIIENKNNYIKFYTGKPFQCIVTNTFYAQNNCREEKDCYMEVTAVLKKKPKGPSLHKKYYFERIW